MTEPKKSIEEIACEDGRYNVQALKFVYEGLGATIQRIREAESQEEEDAGPRHISGEELAYGLANLAMERWGRLARMVWRQWGVHRTRDLGEIVYLMIRYGWMSAQEEDRIEDFDDVFDFEALFEKQFDFELS
ncbi:MAG: hypothetical protein JXA82_06600 [Sedimentisphaerales bacterium]|nr:hypothetical protein [Sedimentisphaerales bacterium]